MSEDYFGLGGSTGLKLGRMRVSGATSMHKSMSGHLSVCAQGLSEGFKCLGTSIKIPSFINTGGLLEVRGS